MFTMKRLGVWVILFSVALGAIACAAGKSRPFKGSGSGVADFAGGTFAGTGEATHVGRFSFAKALGAATDNGDGTVTFTGVAIIVAANGDLLHGTFELTIDLTTEPALGTGILTWDNNGTGRFDNASGSVDISTVSTMAGAIEFAARGMICY